MRRRETLAHLVLLQPDLEVDPIDPHVDEVGVLASHVDSPAAIRRFEIGGPAGREHSGDMSGGGNYLSNESMYRSNRLRIALGATDVPGGHLHVSSLIYPQNPLAITDGAFASDRAQTIEQAVALVKAAGAAVSAH